MFEFFVRIWYDTMRVYERGEGMSFFESVLYGLISGLSEFIPISPQGQQAIMLRLFGLNERDPFRDLLVHIAVLAALLIVCRPMLLSQRRMASHRRKAAADNRAAYDLRLIRTARIPLIIGILLYIATQKLEQSNLMLALFFLINGLLIIVPEYIRHGNKDARFMTGLDGIFLGILGACSVLPGISRIAVMCGYTLARGSERQQAVNWVLQLSIPVLAIFVGLDIFALFSVGFGAMSFARFLGIVISAIAAFIGGYLGVLIVRNLSARTGFSGFAFYSWGLAIFSFILYLIA